MRQVVGTYTYIYRGRAFILELLEKVHVYIYIHIHIELAYVPIYTYIYTHIHTYIYKSGEKQHVVITGI